MMAVQIYLRPMQCVLSLHAYVNGAWDANHVPQDDIYL